MRFNAMKHGILSSLAVLAHEDGGDFADLLVALIEEHKPAGMTERHLVEELAAIIWRKRRVLIAEAAWINEGLKSVANNLRPVMASAAPFQPGLANEYTRLLDLMDETPEQIAERASDLLKSATIGTVRKGIQGNAFRQYWRCDIQQTCLMISAKLRSTEWEEWVAGAGIRAAREQRAAAIRSTRGNFNGLAC